MLVNLRFRAVGNGHTLLSGIVHLLTDTAIPAQQILHRETAFAAGAVYQTVGTGARRLRRARTLAGETSRDEALILGTPPPELVQLRQSTQALVQAQLVQGGPHGGRYRRQTGAGSTTNCSAVVGDFDGSCALDVNDVRFVTLYVAYRGIDFAGSTGQYVLQAVTALPRGALSLDVDSNRVVSTQDAAMLNQINLGIFVLPLAPSVRVAVQSPACFVTVQLPVFSVLAPADVEARFDLYVDFSDASGVTVTVSAVEGTNIAVESFTHPRDNRTGLVRANRRGFAGSVTTYTVALLSTHVIADLSMSLVQVMHPPGGGAPRTKLMALPTTFATDLRASFDATWRTSAGAVAELEVTQDVGFLPLFAVSTFANLSVCPLQPQSTARTMSTASSAFSTRRTTNSVAATPGATESTIVSTAPVITMSTSVTSNQESTPGVSTDAPTVGASDSLLIVFAAVPVTDATSAPVLSVVVTNGLDRSGVRVPSLSLTVWTEAVAATVGDPVDRLNILCAVTGPQSDIARLRSLVADGIVVILLGGNEYAARVYVRQPGGNSTSTMATSPVDSVLNGADDTQVEQTASADSSLLWLVLCVVFVFVILVVVAVVIVARKRDRRKRSRPAGGLYWNHDDNECKVEGEVNIHRTGAKDDIYGITNERYRSSSATRPGSRSGQSKPMGSPDLLDNPPADTQFYDVSFGQEAIVQDGPMHTLTEIERKKRRSSEEFGRYLPSPTSPDTQRNNLARRPSEAPSSHVMPTRHDFDTAEPYQMRSFSSLEPSPPSGPHDHRRRTASRSPTRGRAGSALSPTMRAATEAAHRRSPPKKRHNLLSRKTQSEGFVTQDFDGNGIGEGEFTSMWHADALTHAYDNRAQVVFDAAYAEGGGATREPQYDNRAQAVFDAAYTDVGSAKDPQYDNLFDRVPNHDISGRAVVASDVEYISIADSSETPEEDNPEIRFLDEVLMQENEFYEGSGRNYPRPDGTLASDPVPQPRARANQGVLPVPPQFRQPHPRVRSSEDHPDITVHHMGYDPRLGDVSITAQPREHTGPVYDHASVPTSRVSSRHSSQQQNLHVTEFPSSQDEFRGPSTEFRRLRADENSESYS